jgi:hypothetical protein
MCFLIGMYGTESKCSSANEDYKMGARGEGGISNG